MEADRLRRAQVAAYLAECTLFLFTFPLQLRNLFVRLQEGRYKGVFLRRLWGTAPGIPGSTLLIASGIGETHQAATVAPRLASEVRVLSQLSCNVGSLPLGMDHAPFKWPIGALLTLRRQKPKLILFVGNVSDVHLAFWARAKGIPCALIHTSMHPSEMTKPKTKKRLRFSLMDRAFVQSADQIGILDSFGLASSRVLVTGPQLRIGETQNAFELREKWHRILDARPGEQFIVAGSTHEADEAVILVAIQALWKIHPSVRLLIAPRRLDRPGGFDSVLKDHQVEFACRTKGITFKDQIIALDTMGELQEVYSVADLVLVGGTFSPKIGGHTFAQALEWDVWFTCGPHFKQHASTADELVSRGLLTVCQNSTELAEAWHKQLQGTPKIDLMDQSIAQIAGFLKG